MLIKLALAFILGTFGGLSLLWVRMRNLRQQIDRLLTKLPGYSGDRDLSLSTRAQVRREISRAQECYQQATAERDTWIDLIARAPMGYLQVDVDNRVVFCNARACAWLGVERWEPGRLLLEMVRSLELDRLVAETRQHQTGREIEWVFHHMALPEGSESPVAKSLALRGFSYPLPENGVGIFLENCQEFSELIRAQDRTFAELAHELRTPLTSICLVAETLQTRLSGRERQWVERMLGEAQRLIQLLEDWLDLAQLQKDPNQVLHRNPVDLAALIASAWETLEPLAKRKQISLNACYTGDRAPQLYGDRARLMQVFVNVLDNAIGHSPVNGEIRIEARSCKVQEKMRARIDIIDTGTGFPDNDLDRVFERLYRGRDKNSKTANDSQRSGTGLGLAIVRQIVLAHDGRIVAKNHPETGGAWLAIELPAIADNAPTGAFAGNATLPEQP